MLLDPFEEQFHLPPGLVEAGDSLGRQEKIVGYENEVLPCLWIAITDPAKRVGVMTMRSKTVERDSLVGTDAGQLVGTTGITPAEPGVLLRTCDKECTAQMQTVQSAVIQISLVHDVKGSGSEAQLAQHVDVVNTARRDYNDSREVPSQSQERMNLHRRLGAAERRPGGQGEAKIDGRRIQRVGGFFQFEPEVFPRIKIRRLRDQDVGKVGKNTPVPLLVGIRQSAAGCTRSYAAVIQFPPERPQASLDVPKAFPVCKLGERKDQKLLVATHRPDMKVALVSFDTLRQPVLRQPVHELGKNRSPLVHNAALPSLFEVEG